MIFFSPYNRILGADHFPSPHAAPLTIDITSPSSQFGQLCGCPPQKRLPGHRLRPMKKETIWNTFLISEWHIDEWLATKLEDDNQHTHYSRFSCSVIPLCKFRSTYGFGATSSVISVPTSFVEVGCKVHRSFQVPP